MSIKQAEKEAKKILKLCNEGIHPRKGTPYINFSNLNKVSKIKKIVIIGAGGHSTSILNIVRSLNYEVVAFVDNTNSINKFNNINVISDKDAISKYYKYDFIIGIGDNNIRENIYKKYTKSKYNIKFTTLIHKSAVISWKSEIKVGSVIMPNVTVGPNSKIGEFCILNTNSSIDHDCLMKNFSSIAPGVNTGGEVKIGKNSSIGIGAKIKNKISIGDNVVVGAASYVNSDIESNLTCYGIPAKIIRKNYKKKLL